LLRVVRRLCARAGAPLTEGEHVVERTVTGGVTLTAVLPPVAVRGIVLVLRRAREASRRLEELVHSGAASPAMGTFLEHCVAARANLLVVGPRDGSTAEVVGALELAVAGGQQVVIQRTMTLPGRPGRRCSGRRPAPAQGATSCDVAAHLPQVRLVVELAAPALTLGLVESIGAGVEGAVAVAYGAGLERTLARLGADLAAAPARARARRGAGMVGDRARRRDRDRPGRRGALCVRRIAELTLSTTGGAGVEDIFRYYPDLTDATTGKPGSFAPTGVVPRVAERMKSRGIAVEPGIFQRAARR
jgi:pilus assembly protein CpaF